MSTPGEAFAAFLAEHLANEGYEPATPPETLEPVTRAPAPNPAQGSSGTGTPPAVDPRAAFAEVINGAIGLTDRSVRYRDAIHASQNAGWVAIT